VIELNYTNINKAMNISVQSVFHGGERGKKNFTEGNRRLPIFYNNGDTGATSPRPTAEKISGTGWVDLVRVLGEGDTLGMISHGHQVTENGQGARRAIWRGSRTTS